MVTGGTRGIGRAIVEELADSCTDLTVLARSGSGLDALGDELSSRFPSLRYTPICCDASDLTDLGSALSVWIASAHEDALDLLVLNAGNYTDGDLASIPIDDYIRDLNLNLNSELVVVQRVLPLLRRGTQPRIVIVGSTAAYDSYSLVPSYGISKWGLRGFSINLREELRPDRIGVTFLSPGGTLTDMWADDHVPEGRLIDAKDVAVLLRSTLQLSEQAVVEELIVRPIEGDIHDYGAIG
jgi:short-subunit dehydrogenase